MAITVSTQSTGNSIAGATVACSFPTATVAGSLIVVGVCERTTAGTAGTVADGPGNTYTKITEKLINNSTANGVAAMYYAYNTAQISTLQKITYTKTQSGVATAVQIVTFTGASTATDPLDTGVTNATFAATSKPSIVCGNPATSGEIHVGLIGILGSAGTFTEAGLWSAIPNEAATGTATTDARADGGNRLNSSTNPFTWSPSFTNAVAWAGIVTAFKPPGAATGKVFYQNSMSGLYAGGPHFSDPFDRM